MRRGCLHADSEEEEEKHDDEFISGVDVSSSSQRVSE